jgi:hypothetical protein
MNYRSYLHTTPPEVKDEVRGVRDVCGEDAQVAAVEVEMQRSLGVQHEPHTAVDGKFVKFFQ